MVNVFAKQNQGSKHQLNFPAHPTLLKISLCPGKETPLQSGGSHSQQVEYSIHHHHPFPVAVISPCASFWSASPFGSGSLILVLCKLIRELFAEKQKIILIKVYPVVTSSSCCYFSIWVLKDVFPTLLCNLKCRFQGYLPGILKASK